MICYKTKANFWKDCQKLINMVFRDEKQIIRPLHWIQKSKKYNKSPGPIRNLHAGSIHQVKFHRNFLIWEKNVIKHRIMRDLKLGLKGRLPTFISNFLTNRNLKTQIAKPLSYSTSPTRQHPISDIVQNQNKQYCRIQLPWRQQLCQLFYDLQKIKKNYIQFNASYTNALMKKICGLLKTVLILESLKPSTFTFC